MTDPQKNRRRSRLQVVLALAAVFAALITVVLLLPTNSTGYRFITVGHPISVMSDTTGRWFYYSADQLSGDAPTLAATVRRELEPLGFVEDATNKPWFRFVNGDREVIVCYHHEIATMPTSLLGVNVIHERLPPAQQPKEKWTVVWVHEPGPDPLGVAAFQVKKRVFGW